MIDRLGDDSPALAFLTQTNFLWFLVGQARFLGTPVAELGFWWSTGTCWRAKGQLEKSATHEIVQWELRIYRRAGGTEGQRRPTQVKGLSYRAQERWGCALLISASKF